MELGLGLSIGCSRANLLTVFFLRFVSQVFAFYREIY
jgi:hypothetical protein